VKKRYGHARISAAPAASTAAALAAAISATTTTATTALALSLALPLALARKTVCADVAKSCLHRIGLRTSWRTVIAVGAA